MTAECTIYMKKGIVSSCKIQETIGSSQLYTETRSYYFEVSTDLHKLYIVNLSFQNKLDNL